MIYYPIIQRKKFPRLVKLYIVYQAISHKTYLNLEIYPATHVLRIKRHSFMPQGESDAQTVACSIAF